MSIVSRRTGYRILRAMNDARAVQNHRVARRVGRRAYGKLSGRLARKLFG